MPNYTPVRTWNASHPKADLDNAEIHLRLWFADMGYTGRISPGMTRSEELDYFDFDFDHPSGVFLVMKDEVGTIHDNYGWLKKFQAKAEEEAEV